MGLATRHFLILDADQIVWIPNSRFSQLVAGDKAIPEYASKSVRAAEFTIELLHRKPVGAIRELYYLLYFDPKGRVDQARLLDDALAAVDATISPVLAKSKWAKSGNVIHASGKFASQRREELYLWTPSNLL